ncbi:MAG: ATP-dependent Clp protease adaptor ClpS [Aeoliella sp.]
MDDTPLDPFESSPENPDGGMSTVVTPKRERKAEREGVPIPRYSVVLWDSDDHTFDYVEKMLRELFGHTKKDCEQIAKGVDEEGRAIVLTTTKEHAELKRDQIHAYGKDNMESSKGSMWATIESAD